MVIRKSHDQQYGCVRIVDKLFRCDRAVTIHKYTKLSKSHLPSGHHHHVVVVKTKL